MSLPRLTGALAVLLLAPLAFAGTAADRVHHDGFESGPLDAAGAARFLEQAAFGADRPSIDALLTLGLDGWIDAQLALPATLSRPALETYALTENTSGRKLMPDARVQRWLDTAVTAPDQLRQKMAYALSQIVVVSDLDSGLNMEPVLMAEWSDLLVRNALGNYRTLIAEATRSPAMGRYLTHFRNRRFGIVPRCRDNSGGGAPDVACSSNEATAGGTLAPTIVAYDPPNGGLTAPDENYAREVMQLFTIGLVERDTDFTPLLVADAPVPTYDQAMITTMARVLTGLGHACSGTRTVAGQSIVRGCGGCTGIDCNFSFTNFAAVPPAANINGQLDLVHPDRYEPMVCYPFFHDTGRDQVGFQLVGATGQPPVGAGLELNPGESLPGGMPDAAKSLRLGDAELDRIDEIDPGLPAGTAVNCLSQSLSASAKASCLAYCDDSLERIVDLLFEHPNTASMIARQLIQRLVDSNPSPAYIARVASVFADNGSGVRGDLAAVARAVLLDDEARRAPGHPQRAATAGKPREPLLKLVRVWRAFQATATARSDGFRNWRRSRSPCGGPVWPQCAYQQRPLGAPSVFNFYSPDYRQPGEIADADLFSPELQIINETSTILVGNDLYRQVCSGYGNHDCHGSFSQPVATAWLPPAVLDALPGGGCGTSCSDADDVALIDELDLLLLSGTMDGAIGAPDDPPSTANTGMRGTLYQLLAIDLAGALGEAQPQDARRRKILYLIHLIAISPAFAVQA